MPLSDSAQITAYRLVQEALTNIVKYAQAGTVTVRLQARGASALLTVKDDSRGFEPAAPRRSAHGLMGMRYRVEGAQGRLSIRSAPGRGTCIEAELPLLQCAAAAA
jgi:signal transduction histidine kinase